ncbi:hypothetical protein DVH24_011664 [Malus domestica]|uniref:Gnk2-homologous domain-containing protein n=1 Tax=Malus domestica TaxID=3750 RepID=A0A498JTX0_MALDO|nr:hypothetical protein DVH24_011664 [Malus domestica]
MVGLVFVCTERNAKKERMIIIAGGEAEGITANAVESFGNKPQEDEEVNSKKEIGGSDMEEKLQELMILLHLIAVTWSICSCIITLYKASSSLTPFTNTYLLRPWRLRLLLSLLLFCFLLDVKRFRIFPLQHYAIGLCRGVVTVEDCGECFNDSMHGCPNQMRVTGQNDKCMLHYSNRANIYGVMETSPSWKLVLLTIQGTCQTDCHQA